MGIWTAIGVTAACVVGLIVVGVVIVIGFLYFATRGMRHTEKDE